MIVQCLYNEKIRRAIAPECSHALLPEQPEAVAKAVLDFLAKHHPTETNKQEK